MITAKAHCATKTPEAANGTMSAKLLIPVIMCGGAGTRLWPVSRESMPKQFVPLIDERSTFQQVLARIANADLFDRPIVITRFRFSFYRRRAGRRQLRADIVSDSRRAAIPPGGAARRVLCWPPRRAQRRGAGKRLPGSSQGAARLDRDFGITPTYPATSYGYIRARREA